MLYREVERIIENERQEDDHLFYIDQVEPATKIGEKSKNVRVGLEEVTEEDVVIEELTKRLGWELIDKK